MSARYPGEWLGAPGDLSGKGGHVIGVHVCIAHAVDEVASFPVNAASERERKAKKGGRGGVQHKPVTLAINKSKRE